MVSKRNVFMAAVFVLLISSEASATRELTETPNRETSKEGEKKNEVIMEPFYRCPSGRCCGTRSGRSSRGHRSGYCRCCR